VAKDGEHGSREEAAVGTRVEFLLTKEVKGAALKN
jgi:hypothetical protein